MAPLLLCSAILSAQPPGGGIRGTVRDADFDVPLSGVRVSIVEETGLQTLTSEDGRYFFESIPPGSYTLVFSKSGFGRRVVQDVAVAAGRLTEISVDLPSEVVEMEEMVVTGADPLSATEIGLLEIRAEAVGMQDAISSELIGKAGVGDVAGALKLVTGASVVEGKYATVRGLSDRYTGTTLNGIRLPSSDPRKRAVQVDLFPTGTVDSITVTKTFTPDLPGDFSGGGVDIVTKAVPEERLFKLETSFGYDSLATNNQDFLTNAGGGTEAFGNGNRNLPAIAQLPLPAFPDINTSPSETQIRDAELYDAYTKAFTPAIGVQRGAPGFDHSWGLTVGDSIGLPGGGALGFLGAVSHKKGFSFYRDAVNDGGVLSDPTQSISIDEDRLDTKGTEELLIGSLASLVWQPNDDHELSFKGVLNFSAEDESRLQIQDEGFPSVEINQSLIYRAREVRSLQLGGAHAFRRWSFDWVLADNTTSQEEPDIRFFRYDYNFDSLTGRRPRNSTDAETSRRIWRNLREDNRLLKADFEVPRRSWTGEEMKIRSGFVLDRSDRSFDQRSFTYSFANQFGSLFDPAVQENRRKVNFEGDDFFDLWSDVFLNTENVGLASNDPPAPNQLLWYLHPIPEVDTDYTGDQVLDAAYAMVDLPVSEKWKVIAGARIEKTEMTMVPSRAALGTVEVIQLLDSGDRAVAEVAEEEAIARIDETSILPALGVTCQVAPRMKLRFAWSQTFARPTLREMAPVATSEFILGDELVGNPGLTISEVTNWDLRWEWFRRPGEILAASIFYKELHEPIEYISFDASNRSFIQPVNFPEGTVLGFEAEARSSWDIFAEVLEDFSAGLNLTFLESEVEVPGFEQDSLRSFGLNEPSRPLQGQPEYLINANVTWDHDRWGSSAGVFYSFVGETLLTGAARGTNDGTPNVYEESWETLDFKFSQTIRDHLSLGLKATNLLRPAKRRVYRTPGGDEALKTERETATDFSLSVSWEW